MKSDLDRLMQENNLDALLVTGPAQHNPFMYYFTGGGHLTSADLIKPRGDDPLLFYSPMERDEAAKTSLPTKNITDYPFKALREKANGNLTLALAMRYKQMLIDAGVTSGRVSLYGKTSLGSSFAIFTALQKLMPEIEITGEVDGSSTLLQAMATKDEAEIERMRGMGKLTTGVVGQVAEFLSSHTAKDGALVKADGQPLTIRDVKSKINLWLAERGAENPKGCIFAIGRDAGVPHSAGTPSDVLELGKTIIFDIFPCERGGGYFYDFTRTWTLGYAPDDVLALYEDVYAVYQQIMRELQADEPCGPYQERTCELFEAQGHPTIRQNRAIQEGYVHSLGHGLGLHVHEAPWFRGKESATPSDKLYPGSVVTIEPGLYYPERGMGVRLEDTVYVTPGGEMEILADFPLDLVLPVKSKL